MHASTYVYVCVCIFEGHISALDVNCAFAPKIISHTQLETHATFVGGVAGFYVHNQIHILAVSHFPRSSFILIFYAIHSSHHHRHYLRYFAWYKILIRLNSSIISMHWYYNVCVWYHRRNNNIIMGFFLKTALQRKHLGYGMNVRCILLWQ